MTVKKAIELIHNDITFHQEQIARFDKFVVKFTKKYDYENLSPDSQRKMILEIILMIPEILKKYYNGQLEYYIDILKELETKEKTVKKHHN